MQLGMQSQLPQAYPEMPMQSLWGVAQGFSLWGYRAVSFSQSYNPPGAETPVA